MQVGRAGFTGLLAFLLLTVAAGRGEADPASELHALDQTVAAFNQEIANQNKNIGDMQRILDDYAAGRGPAPRADQLKPMGQAGVGVVGAGHDKHPVLQKFVKEYESVANPQNWAGAARTLNEIAGERNKLIPRRKQELGLGPDGELPDAEKRKIQDIAVGIAHFKVEIIRSGEAIARLRVKVAEFNRERAALLARMTEAEKGAYRTRRAAAPSSPSAPTAAGGSPPPAPTAPAVTNDPALIARLDNAFAKLDAAAANLEQSVARDQAQCAQTANVLKPDSPDGIAARAKAVQGSIDRAVADMRPDLVGDQASYTGFKSLVDTLERIVGQAADAAGQVCAISRTTDPDIAAGKEAERKARNLGIIAGRIADEAQEAAGRLYDRFSSTKDIPFSVIENVREQQDRFANFCGGVSAPLSGAKSPMENMQAPLNDVTGAMAEAYGGKLSPELTASYQAKLDNHTARVNASTSRIDYDSCNSERIKAGNLCFGDQFGRKFHESLLALIEMYSERVAGQRSQADRVKTEAQHITALVNRQVDAEAASRQCLADAESKQPAIDPKLLGEANDLGDPSKAACKSADLRSRAARLRDPKFSALPGVNDKAAELERLAGVYDTAKAHFDRAKAAYENGDIALVHAELDKSQAQIDSIAGRPDCSSAKQTIAQGRDRADRLATAIQRAKETLYQCEADTLRAHMQAVEEKTKHPALTALKARMQRQLAAINQFNAANDTYKAGNLIAARDQLNAIKTSLAGAPPDDCAGLRRKIDQGLNKIDGLTRVATTADEMIRTCNTDGIKRFNYEASDSEHPTIQQLRGRLSAALETCTRARSAAATTDIARAHNDCKSRFGARGIAVHAPDSLTGYRCDCDSPYRLEGGSCVMRKTESELAAERNASCPSGYRAGPADANGKYVCLPSKETANAWCKANNAPGYYAGGIKSDGSFNCIPTKRTASARCQQANPGISGVFAGSIKPDGSFSCFRKQRTAQPRPTPQPQQPSHDTATSAAAAAVAGAAIQGIIGAVGRSQPRAVHQPPVRTHQPTSRPPASRPPASSAGRCNVHNPISSSVGCY